MTRSPDVPAAGSLGCWRCFRSAPAVDSYVPASVEDFAPPATVRARITGEAAADLSDILESPINVSTGREARLIEAACRRPAAAVSADTPANAVAPDDRFSRTRRR